MGCRATLTCAPYHADPPAFGEKLAWAESNAVIFANSVLGARTLKTPQFMDLAAAICGYVPLTGPMTDEGRAPGIVFDLGALPPDIYGDPLTFELIGLVAGEMAGARIPLLVGIPAGQHKDRLRSLCAALGVSGSMPMIHVEGSTPESTDAVAIAMQTGLYAARSELTGTHLREAARRLGRGREGELAAVALGAPHLGLGELASIATHTEGFRVPVFLSVGRDVHAEAQQSGLAEELVELGACFVRDTCTYYGPLMAERSGIVMTNSAKWASYGGVGLPIEPALGSLDECCASAVAGACLYDGGWLDVV
jgi:predicted aconitase